MHTHTQRDGGVTGFSFIPSLSILSTASLTRRMTVTMEARQKREEKTKNSNDDKASTNI